MFPTNLVDLPNPDPKTPTNSPVTPLSGCIANLNSVVEALQAKVGVDGSAVAGSVDARLAVVESSTSGFLPATHDAVGDLIESAVSKSNPDDADLVPITDSTAGHILRKISWASIKAALGSLYARLGGVAGGQTLIGGTAASENLTLRSTAHATRGKVLFGTGAAYDETTTSLGIGTQSPAAELHALATTEQLRLGYDASNYYSITVGSGGVVTHSATGTQVGFKTTTTTATLGSELLSNGGFSGDLASWTDSGASWSWSAGVALHTAGSASTLSQNVSVTSGSTYQIVFTVGSRTAGSVSVSLGAVAVPNIGSGTTFTSNGTYTRTVVAGASGSVSLTITPSSDFAGNVDAVSCKLVTLGSIPSPIAIVDSGGSLALDFRVSATSLGIGRESIQSLTSGLQNTALGSQAQRLLTTGSANVALGWRAQYSMDNGGQNTAVGHQAMYLLTSGSDNTAVGYGSSYGITLGQNNVTVGSLSGYGITTGSQNTVCGVSSLRNITTQFGNTAIGYLSGRYLADGSSPLTDCANSVYVGASTKGTAAATNENVFGYNAIGIGSNSCVIGSSAVTKCQIYGDIILDKTVTAAGTTGARTINKTVGSVNFAAGATSLVVTNNRVTTASVIGAWLATNDATMKSVVPVAASGSFTLTANAAATAETRVNFFVIN